MSACPKLPPATPTCGTCTWCGCRSAIGFWAALHDAGVGAGIHYPVPIHLQGAFASLGYDKGRFPVTEQAADELLSLPLYPELSDGQQDTVVDALKHALAGL